MVVGLDLINKHQSVILFLHSITCHRTQSQIEIIHRLSIGKSPVSKLVCLHIYLNVVGKKLLSDFTNDKGLTYLARAIYNQNLIRL